MMRRRARRCQRYFRTMVRALGQAAARPWNWLGGCPIAALNIAVKALSLA
jgi:hypothetical protein